MRPIKGNDVVRHRVMTSTSAQRVRLLLTLHLLLRQMRRTRREDALQSEGGAGGWVGLRWRGEGRSGGERCVRGGGQINRVRINVPSKAADARTPKSHTEPPMTC